MLTTTTKPFPYRVQVLDRALAILDTVGDQPGGCGLAEISTRLSLHKSTVHRLLGTAPDERLVELAGALVGRRRAHALELFDGALRAGVQVGELADQLLAYFRDLMVLACGAGEALLLSVDDDQRGRLKDQASAGGQQAIVAALQILAETKTRMKGATYSRVLLELALVRIATLDQLDNLAELIV